MLNKIELLVTGKNTDYFFKELIKNKINIYNIDKNKNFIKIQIDYNDYKKVKKIKTSCKIKIIKYYGISRIKYLIKNYYYLIIFIIIGILLNILLSKMILTVEVVTPNKNLVKIVKEDLKKYGISKYHLKVNYKKKEAIKEKILNIEKDNIEWLEIEEIGTKYIVKVEQRKKNKEELICNPRHIVSKKKATIISIQSSSGEIKKKINDYVEKGDIIISGFIYNKDEIKTKKCAIGKVYGETWYKVEVTIPKKYQEKKLLNNKRPVFKINFLEEKLIFLNKLRNYQENVYNIIEDNIIPIKVSIGNFQELKITTKNYNINNSEKLALKEAEKKINKKLKKDEKVISKKVLKKQEKNSKIKMEVFFKVKEDITDYFDISNIDINDLNKKEE